VCRIANAEFDATADSVSTARHFVAACLHRWGVADHQGDALLLTSELVSNSIVHAGSGGVVSAALALDVLEIGVTDFDTRSLPTLQTSRKRANGSAREGFANGGRGLMLVDRLADEWGADALPQGKYVWFRLHNGDRAFRPACRCDSEDVDRVRIGSGRFISTIEGAWGHPQ
jgi:sigma-B regulation protein RsbU (phosphoserine phosphatase)